MLRTVIFTHKLTYNSRGVPLYNCTVMLRTYGTLHLYSTNTHTNYLKPTSVCYVRTVHYIQIHTQTT